MGMIQAPNQTPADRLDRMVQQYEKDLLRICCIYLRNRTAAEDVVQETFLKAFKNMDTFRGESSEKTWLIRIAINCCRDYRRSAWYRYIDFRVSIVDQAIQRMFRRFAVTLFLGFIDTERQAGDGLRDHANTGINRGKLDRCLCIDCLSGTAGAEVKGWCGADIVLGLVPSTEQGCEGIFHEDYLLWLMLWYTWNGISETKGCVQ